jgi:hypothetical protein
MADEQMSQTRDVRAWLLAVGCCVAGLFSPRALGHPTGRSMIRTVACPSKYRFAAAVATARSNCPRKAQSLVATEWSLPLPVLGPYGLWTPTDDQTFGYSALPIVCDFCLFVLLRLPSAPLY